MLPYLSALENAIVFKGALNMSRFPGFNGPSSAIGSLCLSVSSYDNTSNKTTSDLNILQSR